MSILATVVGTVLGVVVAISRVIRWRFQVLRTAGLGVGLG
jgi:hypothetical protein